MNQNSLKLFIASCMVGFCSGEKLQAQTNTQPNIIFIMVDDMGWGDLGFQFQNQRAKINDRSEPSAKTPTLDLLAAQGVQFSNHYSPAPVCAPSRASFMLGQHQGHSNVRDNQFDKAIENNHTLATVLKSAGYSTAAFGKWGLQGQDKDSVHWSAQPLNRGFDYYFGYMRHGDGHEHYPKEGLYRGKKEVYENLTNVSNGLDKCYTADLWTASAKRWIVDQKKTLKSKKPFFIFLAYDTPHAVLELPTQEYPSGGGLSGGIQWLGETGHMINTASGVIDSWIDPDYSNATYDSDKNGSTPEVKWPNVYQRYATSTGRIDHAVADLIQLTKDLKIDDNTIIIFTSDNGPSMESYLKEDYNPDFFNSFGPFDGIKRDVLQGGIRIPAIAYWPGHFTSNKVVKNPCSSYDWLPTFAQLARVPVPAVADGVSLVPSLTGIGNQPKSFVYVEYFEGGNTPSYQEFLPEHRGKKRNQMQMIQQDNLVGLRYDIQSNNDDFELYDVDNDPQEANNLANSPGMDKVQQLMKDKVLQSRRPNISAKRPYDNDLIPSISVTNIKQGVEWKSYSGNFSWVPEVSQIALTENGIVSSPEAFPRIRMENKAVCFYGYLKVPADGTYTFFLKTDGKAFLRIHDAAVLDADFAYKKGAEKQANLNLKAGLHPFRLTCIEKSDFDLQWSSAGIAKQSIPASAFVLGKNN